MRSGIADLPGKEHPWFSSTLWIHLLAGIAVFGLYYGDRLFKRRTRQ